MEKWNGLYKRGAALGRGAAVYAERNLNLVKYGKMGIYGEGNTA